MTDDTSTPPKQNLSFGQQVRSFPFAFWVANVIELVERFSFYGVRMIAAVYITTSAAEGGLELTSTDRGVFFGTWSLIQCILPMFTGGFSDRYGYRKSLMIAFGINMIGYAMMGFTDSWWSFMFACCLIGTGTAIFKPPLHGTLAHCVDESNSSIGWGLFYQVVNIGGFIGPVVCGFLRLLSWKYAFFAAAGIIVVNILITGFFLKDYAEGGKKQKGPGKVFAEAITTLKDFRFAIFLAIFSCFYFSFMQLWDQLPTFIDQWVETNDIATWVANLTGMDFFANLAADGGQFNPEWILQIDSVSIIVFVLLIAFISSRFNPISAMIVGMLIACVGLLLVGTATTGWACCFGIFVFSFGEMACNPKFSEYIGLMAPSDKKALYMGYSNIPFAIGWAGANYIGGPIYTAWSSRTTLAKDYLQSKLGQSAEAVDGLTQDQLLPRVAELLGESEAAARQILWNQYQPQKFWYLCVGVGIAAAVAMIGYHFWLKADAAKRGGNAAST